MTPLSPELRTLIASGPLAHLTTINPDGSPQVTMIWIGLDDDTIVSGHMGHYKKLKNIERDPRVVLSFTAERDHEQVLNPYAVLTATATVQASDHAWSLLDRLTKTYMNPETHLPRPTRPRLHHPLQDRTRQRHRTLDRHPLSARPSRHACLLTLFSWSQQATIRWNGRSAGFPAAS